MEKRQFPKDFVWGASTASYQVEGAAAEDGRTFSIWDSFCRIPGKVALGHTGDVSCDQYHRFREDAALMRQAGVGAYRFSLAWPRIFPDESGKPNPKGFDYYNALVDELLSRGILPVATLYHWDLPQYLEDRGGWPERDTAYRFRDFASFCFDKLSDRVRMWITLNEPFCSAILGYLEGIHAPGKTDRCMAYRAVHTLNLAHGLAVEEFRKGAYPGKIGISLNLVKPRPATLHEEDVLAADRAMDLQTRMFLDPIAGRGYPERHLKAYPEVEMPIEPGDLDIIAADIDFLSLNYYWEDAVSFDEAAPEAFKIVPSGYPVTDMGWSIVPEGLYRLLKWVHEQYEFRELYITENGCAMHDVLSPDGNSCRDAGRIEYLRTHLLACAKALREGVRLKGYFLWSLIDNFEWSWGYTKRFGIIYCDYNDGRRIPKDSYFYYREIIAGHENLDSWRIDNL